MSQSQALEKLKQLKQLYEEGLITEDEFKDKKKLIIDRMTARPPPEARASAKPRPSTRSPREEKKKPVPRQPEVQQPAKKECAPDECWRCLDRLHGKVVTSNEKNYHIDCFQCYVCKESLVTQTFYPLGVEVVCAKHVDADVGGTCPKCGEDIVGDYVEADGERYHDNNQCFVCAYAGCALDGGWGRGADGEPYCFPHLQLMGAKRCVECQKMISSELVTFGGQSYHRRCMVCAFCQNPLADGKFYEFDQKPFCYECHRNLHYQDTA